MPQAGGPPSQLQVGFDLLFPQSWVQESPSVPAYQSLSHDLVLNQGLDICPSSPNLATRVGGLLEEGQEGHFLMTLEVSWVESSGVALLVPQSWAQESFCPCLSVPFLCSRMIWS